MDKDLIRAATKKNAVNAEECSKVGSQTFDAQNRNMLTAGDLVVLQNSPTVHQSGTIDGVPKAILSRID